MEACGRAHHLGHSCVEQGQEPRLMSPLYVRTSVKFHKTDYQNTEAIAEAATRPTMSFMTLKRPEQLDLQALHRARERLLQNRTRLVNQARGFLMERGIRIGTGRYIFQRELRRLLEDDVSSPMPSMIRLLSDMATELAQVLPNILHLLAQIRILLGPIRGAVRITFDGNAFIKSRRGNLQNPADRPDPKVIAPQQRLCSARLVSTTSLGSVGDET